MESHVVEEDRTTLANEDLCLRYRLVAFALVRVGERIPKYQVPRYRDIVYRKPLSTTHTFRC